MALLTKAAILAADDLPTIDVAVPEWGGNVRVRMMNAAEREQLEAEYLFAQKDGMVAPPNWRARHMAMCAINEDGTQMFTEQEAVKLGTKSGIAMMRVFDAINTFNKAAPAAVEDAAGN